MPGFFKKFTILDEISVLIGGKKPETYGDKMFAVIHKMIQALTIDLDEDDLDKILEFFGSKRPETAQEKIFNITGSLIPVSTGTAAYDVIVNSLLLFFMIWSIVVAFDHFRVRVYTPIANVYRPHLRTALTIFAVVICLIFSPTLIDVAGSILSIFVVLFFATLFTCFVLIEFIFTLITGLITWPVTLIAG